MSDVRLSNGSPPLERVDARLADHSRPSVCRNLFGAGSAGDAAELRRDCAEQLREIERAAQDRWNFNFELDQPLAPGQYEWEAVDGRRVPDFYSRPARGGDTAERAPPRTSPTTGNGAGEDTATRKRRSADQQDGASQRKRTSSDAEEANHCPDPSTEQTPRKSQPNT